MRIREIRERTIALGSDVRNAYVDFSTMTASLVAVETDVVRSGRPVTGYGFSSPGRYGQGEMIRDRVMPRVLEAEPERFLDRETGEFDPVLVHAAMRKNEKPGGHGDRSVAIGAVDAAMWDLAAKLREVPLAKLFAERYGDGTPAECVWVYAAGGYYSGRDSVSALVEELTSYVDVGFAHVKMKIGGAPLDVDEERVLAAVQAIGSGELVAVDANGRFDLETALAYGRMLEPLRLLWFEEPGDPLDYELHRQVSESYGPALATGENLFSLQDVRNVLRYAGMRPHRDYLQMDPALSYGPTEFIRMVQQAEALGWQRSRFVPHGGHQLNLALAAGLGLGGSECYPSMFAPVGGLADSTLVEGGLVRMLDVPGIGVEEKKDLWDQFADL
jgi:L-alanine-DL-glutamate epimerase-like enolase superfamily enzyme